jgi:hypothetical protein
MPGLSLTRGDEPFEEYKGTRSACLFGILNDFRRNKKKEKKS